VATHESAGPGEEAVLDEDDIKALRKAMKGSKRGISARSNQAREVAGA